MRYSILAFAVGVLVVADAAPVVGVELVHPERATVVRYVALPGRIAANQQATIHAKVAGYLTALDVDKGDSVTAGQVIGEIEVPELVADLRQLRAELAVAEIDLRRVDQAQRRAPDLVVPQKVDDARGRVEIARARLDRVEQLLAYARLSAPFAGVVTARFVDPGAFIPAATSTVTGGGAVVTIMDFATVRVQVPVPEREAARIEIGQPVAFTVDVLGRERFTAAVSRFGYAIDPVVQTMLVEADVANPGGRLRPGMFVTAQIGIERRDDVWTLPRDAVVIGAVTSSVFVLDGVHARQTPVEVGVIDGDRVEIVAGLAGDDNVLRGGVIPLVDGAEVRIGVDQ